MNNNCHIQFNREQILNIFLRIRLKNNYMHNIYRFHYGITNIRTFILNNCEWAVHGSDGAPCYALFIASNSCAELYTIDNKC